MKTLYCKFSILACVIFFMNTVSAQLVYKSPELKDFYILDTILIKNPLQVVFNEPCKNEASQDCWRSLIVDKYCLDNYILKLNLTFNESSQYCGYLTVSLKSLYDILKESKNAKAIEIMDSYNDNYVEIIEKEDTLYSGMHIQKQFKYVSEIRKFYLILMHIDYFNRDVHDFGINIDNSGYILIAFPYINKEILAEIRKNKSKK
jgi:hypothetical protein